MEKVLFLVKSREFGGLEVVLLDWFSRIDYSKVSVVLCCYGTESFRERLAALKLPVEYVQLQVPDNKSFRHTFLQWRRLFSALQPQKIILVEAVVSELGLACLVAARSWHRGPVFLFEANWGRADDPNVPIERKLHYGLLPGIGWHRHKETLKQRIRGLLADHTFVVSQAIKDNLVRCYGYPGAKTSVLYHGVDTQRFQPSPEQCCEVRRSYGIPHDAIVVVSHGRLVPRKRVDRILKAFDALCGEHPELWLLVTCYGPMKEQIEKIAAQSPARDRIKLVDFQSDSSRLLKASDIYVLSSNDEGFGLAILEALSTGLVCAATDGPGPRDIIADGENGIRVGASDEGVVAGLRRALSLSEEDRGRFAARARKTVEERFEVDAAIRRALDAFGVPWKQQTP